MQAENDGMRAVSINEMYRILPEVQMVFNTVPAQIIGDREMKALQPDCWLLELASAPYGFDRGAAEQLKLPYAVLPALPARYAPKSAALALKDAAVQLLREVQA